ncbi:Vps54-like protein-domain-containing protein [Mycotypha africana]|uniref:Vps54-like protein-domain-containing protein n=1 Tax=Mycotypha africana TaxID=64632 RepID=UPI002301DAA4|nr:Vps54-like protein-domain-containing protein [Mycotypha africana]KAI8979697.1 Vps54-like protein-domain-containing protein [Mycotypha africana]
MHMYNYRHDIMANETPPSRASVDKASLNDSTASDFKVAYLANRKVKADETSPASTPLTEASGNELNPPTASNTHIRQLARERPFAREEYNINNASNGRPASIRSAASIGRPVNKFLTGHHVRSHSNYSNFSTMSETALPWTTQDIGFNAISGVLNDPAKTKEFNRPNKGDIPPVSHASIPRIKSSDFEMYLKHIEPVFERYRHNKLNNKEEVQLSYHSTPTNNDEEDASASAALSSSSAARGRRQSKRLSRNPYSLPQHVLSSESFLDDISVRTPPRELPMIENVPSIFFAPEFRLEHPHIFDTVCEGADIVGESGSNLSVSTNSILQEKLSNYLDTVEVHLLCELENRSSSFFEALSNLQALHQQTVSCVSQIHTIRQRIKQIQNTECKDGLEIIRLQVRKRNIEKLYKITKIIRNIRASQPMIQILLGKGDYFGALDLIDETKGLLNKPKTEEGEERLDLGSIKALSNFSSQLDEMQRAVGIMMQHDFLSILLSDLSYRIEGLDQTKAKELLFNQAESRVGENADDKLCNLNLEETELQERLKPSAIGLLRTEMFSATLQNYRERLMVEIKDIIRKRYPSISATGSPATTPLEEQGGYLAKQLKSMPFSSFFQMLLEIFSTLIVAVHRAATYHQLFIRIAETQRLNEESLAQIEGESADIVYSATDLAHARCGKLMGFRSDQNALLNSKDFYRLSYVVRSFISQSEVFCGRTCYGLRGNIASQEKAFMEHFHMERVKQETQLIENEQWTASEVPSDFQLIVDRICEGRISSFSDDTKSQQQQMDENDEKSSKYLYIDGNKFYIVGCSLLILKMFEDYLKCVLNLEDMTVNIMQKLIELLKLFNSRVCQVILGAGAMRSAGLKNITAKHLALASQSLAIMIELIPKLKYCISCHMPSKQIRQLADFDRTIKDYTDHQGEVHAKLISIMKERFSAHVKAMQAIQWDKEDSQTGKHANTYMETLVTETVRLHKVLSKYLPVHDLKFIMTQVFETFTTQLSTEISTIKIDTQEGKDRLKKDATFFTQRLSLLNNVDPPSNAVLETVDKIMIPTSTKANDNSIAEKESRLDSEQQSSSGNSSTTTL